MPEPSDLERAFETLAKQCGLSGYVREYQFYLPRKWRFDFAWPEQRVAVELEGGVFAGGRHTRGKGFEADCRKYNRAAVNGWTVLRYTSGMIGEDTLGCMEQIKRALEATP